MGDRVCYGGKINVSNFGTCTFCMTVAFTATVSF